MDRHVKIAHVVRNGDFKTQDCVMVTLSPDYNRAKHADIMKEKLQEATINSIWSERILKNPKLYNGTKFRFYQIDDGEASTQNRQIEMKLGVTDYKEYLGTNWAPNVSELQDRGCKVHGDPQAFLSDPLGVGAFVVTSDDCVIVLKRSVHCGEAQNQWDMPGGHPEPNEVVGCLSLAEIDVRKIKGSDVVEELFDSILREVVDEVNIPMDQLSPPVYLGTAQNTTSADRPSSIFKIQCKLSSQEVRTLYQLGSQCEAEESTNISFLPLASVHTLQTENEEFWDQLAPAAKGVITVYCLSHGLRTY